MFVDMFCVCVDVLILGVCVCVLVDSVCVSSLCACLCAEGVYVESNMAAAAADPAVASARHSANERRLSLTQRWAVNQS